MMRSMRAIVKPVFYVLAISFVAWLAIGQVTDILGGGKDVVLKVNGEVVRSQPFQLQYQAALEQYRRQQGGARLSREDEQQVQNQVADQFIHNILLERAYRRLGITVSDEEIIRAARSGPPPQLLQQVLQEATFQTNGQFDITKWQRYLSSAGPEFTSQIEQLYRDYLPQRKLQEYLTADVYVSDAKLWRIWRDQHEAVTVAVLAMRPEDVPDSLAPVSDAELRQYYEAHKNDFKRPAAAWLSYVAQPRAPDARDSVAALARVRALRAEITGGKAKFEDVAKKESSDSGTGARGGDLGWIKRTQPGFDPRFVAGLRSLTVGVVSEPVLSSFGYNLIRIDAAKGDSVHARHILVAIAPQGQHLDAIDARTDTLDPAGVPPLAQLRARVLDEARHEKKKTLARQHAEQVARELRDAADLLAAARAHGLRAEKEGPFTRVTAAPEFTRNPVVLGAAFALRPGERSPLIAGETGFFLLQGIARTNADSAAWQKQRDQQRETLIRPIEQARIQQYLAALRAQATIVDRRNEIFRPAAAASES